MKNLTNYFDTYNVVARFLPTWLALFPFVLGLIMLVNQSTFNVDLLLSLLFTSGVSIALADFARSKGKITELNLYEKWGGKPTTILLRYFGSTNLKTLERYHNKLAKLISIKMPTQNEEHLNPSEADKIYDSCISFLLEKTRDKTRFNLIFSENINYGFRRNTYALRVYGQFFSIIGLIATLANTVLFQAEINSMSAIYTLLIILLVYFWFVVVNEGWVKQMALSYAQRLLAGCEEL